MSAHTAKPGSAPRLGKTILSVAALALLVGMIYDTKLVRIGSAQDTQAAVFSPETYGKKAFPGIQAAIEKAAVDAKELSAAIAKDKAAAGEKYGKPGSVGPIFSVKFSGVATDMQSGNLSLRLDGLPDTLKVRVQTGPAINGTDVRDATGAVDFGSFTNQIEYQDAGSALNNEIKTQVLADFKRDGIVGKKVDGIGVFQLINPNSWLITPVRVSVQ